MTIQEAITKHKSLIIRLAVRSNRKGITEGERQSLLDKIDQLKLEIEEMKAWTT